MRTSTPLPFSIAALFLLLAGTARPARSQSAITGEDLSLPVVSPVGGDSTVRPPASDSTALKRLKRGRILAGALGWFPGAVAGVAVARNSMVDCCSEPTLIRLAVAGVVGGGVSAGVAAAVAGGSSRCALPVRMARGIAGGVIGSVVGALGTAVIAGATAGIGVLAAPVIIPIASAGVAASFLARC